MDESNGVGMNEDHSSQQSMQQHSEDSHGGGDGGSGGGGGGGYQSPMQPTDDKSVEDRKLFIGGLSWSSTEDDLNKYFSQFGEVEMSEVKRDSSGTSRGFGFIIFQSKEAIPKVFAKSEHIISGKKVDPKQARAKTGRIFIGGINTALTEEDIKEHFGQFGNVVDVQMPMNHEKGTHKGFAFVTYDAMDPIKILLEDPHQTIKGKTVECKKVRYGGFGYDAWGGYGYGGYDPYGGYYGGGWGDPSGGGAMPYWGPMGSSGGGKGPRGRGSSGSNRQAPY
ncbi:unnamed protein product [Cyprideis torosa]|uniref:Uncharacterized protein n=1 Tax=Cyprideis torosa TaxID=163714 RepID=A0A7R8WNP7_9CRUS|nr:unnamed protein product [Cyprideis torosa]CAG0900677.1 unnamed protein product [Cyprideis torosa]